MGRIRALVVGVALASGLAAAEADDVVQVEDGLRRLQAEGLLAVLRQADPQRGERILEQLLQTAAAYEQTVAATNRQRLEHQRQLHEAEGRIKHLLAQKASLGTALADLNSDINRRREQLRQLVESVDLELDRAGAPRDDALEEAQP